MFTVSLTEKHSNVIHTVHVQPLQATSIPISSPAVTPLEEYATPGFVQFRQKKDEKASSAVKRQGIHIKKSTDDTQTDSDSPYSTNGAESAAERIFASGPNYSPNTVVAKLFMDYATSEETWGMYARITVCTIQLNSCQTLLAIMDFFQTTSVYVFNCIIAHLSKCVVTCCVRRSTLNLCGHIC